MLDKGKKTSTRRVGGGSAVPTKRLISPSGYRTRILYLYVGSPIVPAVLYNRRCDNLVVPLVVQLLCIARGACLCDRDRVVQPLPEMAESTRQ